MERERDTSSDEDENIETQTLIHQNLPQLHLNEPQFRNSPRPSNPNPNSVFHIQNQSRTLNTPTRSQFPNNFTPNSSFFAKKYVFLFFSIFFIFVLIFFITNNLHNGFVSSLDGKTGNLILNRMRENELEALYLLRQQKLGLFKLWNDTINANNNNNVDNGSAIINNGSLSDFKWDVFNQISLNKQIQQVLLSTHRMGNDSDLGFDSNVNETNDMKKGCGKVFTNLADRKTIEWKPDENKYLFAICLSGQMSNHLICLEKHMFFAAMLKRVLVIPSPKVDFQFDQVLDIEHINNCVGKKVVVPFEKFAEVKKGHLRIDKFLCYFSAPDTCYMDNDHVKKLKSLGVSMSKLEAVWDEDIGKPSKKTMQDVVTKFSSKEDVIAIGDVFYADIEHDMVMQPGGPIAHKCKTLIEPNRVIMLTAQRFVQTFLGENFIALHFRRHGFLKFCNAKVPSCFFPIPQAARCINRLVEKANTPVVYLSTDAAESETSLLQSLIVLNGEMVPLVKRPARNSAEKWDALLYRQGLEGDKEVEAMLDKTISAMSTVFIGAPGSTFTEDILRLRKDWGKASVCDEYLCQGEVPDFIADDE